MREVRSWTQETCKGLVMSNESSHRSCKKEDMTVPNFCCSIQTRTNTPKDGRTDELGLCGKFNCPFERWMAHPCLNGIRTSGASSCIISQHKTAAVSFKGPKLQVKSLLLYKHCLQATPGCQRIMICTNTHVASCSEIIFKLELQTGVF